MDALGPPLKGSSQNLIKGSRQVVSLLGESMLIPNKEHLLLSAEAIPEP